LTINWLYTKKKELIINYSITDSKDGEWAGNIEISNACTLLNCNINIHTLNEEGYSVFFQYNSERSEIQKNIENIDISYIDENHFNSLIPNNDMKKKNDIASNNINMKDLKLIILEDKLKANRKITEDLKLDSKSKKFIDYPLYELANYYNEIYSIQD